MLNNKADFILEFNEKSDTNIKKNDVDWSQSKVLFIAPSFTSFQKQSINFKDLPIELWEIKHYSGDMVLFTRIASEGAAESIKTVSKKEKKISVVAKEIKTYSEDNLLRRVSENIRDEYFKIKEEILQFESDVYEKITKTMICFYSDGKGLVWIQPMKNSIRLYLRKGKYEDKYGLIKEEGWGGYPELTLTEDNVDLLYLKGLLEQAYAN